MFRNLRLYRVHGDWPESEEALSARLLEVPFKPCGAYTERSAGFEAPVADLGDCLARRVAGADLFRLRAQTRLLPNSAVNEALEERVEAFTARSGREPSRREKRELKDEVIAELMPRALLKSDRIWGLYLRDERLLGIDTSSEAHAERFLDKLRSAFGSLEVTPLGFKESVGRLLNAVFLSKGPPAFVVGRECRMKDPSVGTTSVSWMDVDLTDASVQKHVRDGFKLDRLAMTFEEVVSFVLDDAAMLRKIRFAGMEVAEDGIDLDEDPIARLDAEFVLLTGMLKRLMQAMKKQLGGYG